MRDRVLPQVRIAARALVCAGALALAACAGGQPVTRQVVVSGVNFANVYGEEALIVRAFAADAGERREVVGAECDVVSSLYGTSLVTPARLVVPSFGPQSPELTVSCTALGLAGSAQVAVIGRWRYPPGYYGPFGPYGYDRPGYAWGGWGWGGPAAYPVFNYPDVNVYLR